MNDKTVHMVRQWFGLNSHTIHDVIFHSIQDSELGVHTFELTYIATRLYHLLNMPNNNEKCVRVLYKVSLASGSDSSFLGFKRKPEVSCTHSPVLSVGLDKPDFNWLGQSYSGVDRI